jgi:hypothetical protein
VRTQSGRGVHLTLPFETSVFHEDGSPDRGDHRLPADLDLRVSGGS